MVSMSGVTYFLVVSTFFSFSSLVVSTVSFKSDAGRRLIIYFSSIELYIDYLEK